MTKSEDTGNARFINVEVQFDIDVGAVAVSSLLRHLQLSSDALLWMCKQNVTLSTSISSVTF